MSSFGSLGDITRESAVQWLSAAFTGTTLDYLFPTPATVTASNFLRVGLEILAQFALDGIFTYQGFTLLRSWGLTDAADPTNHMVWLFALYASQPNLNQKVTSFNAFLRTGVQVSAFANIQDLSSVGKSGNPVNQDSQASMVQYISGRDFTGPFSAPADQ